METATDYLKREWGDPIWEEWERDNVIWAMEEYADSKWVEYSKRKPEIGQLVLVHRDIEIRQMYVTKWNEEDERYADLNAINYWREMSYPPDA